MKKRYGRTINDLGFHSFLQILKGYAEKCGKMVRVIDRFEPTSKTCSCCHHVIEEMDQYIADSEYQEGPIILCGDLNIYYGNQEPAENSIKKHFFDRYNQMLNLMTFSNCTYCDLTGYWFPQYVYNLDRERFYPKADILDYVLLLNELPSGKRIKNHYPMQTRRILAHDIADPAKALSDHHALLTTIGLTHRSD